MPVCPILLEIVADVTDRAVPHVEDANTFVMKCLARLEPARILPDDSKLFAFLNEVDCFELQCLKPGHYFFQQ